jgi:hypothetical protein
LKKDGQKYAYGLKQKTMKPDMARIKKMNLATVLAELT